MFNFKKLVILFALILPLFLFPVFIAANGAPAFPGGGSGTAQDPYIITDIYELQSIDGSTLAYYKLGNDIDASVTATWNENPLNPGTFLGFEPLGSADFPAKIYLDGDYHKITNLYINRLGDYIGLIGYNDPLSIVQNIGLENVDITGGALTGGFYGSNEAPIINSYVTGNISGAHVVGGLTGQTGPSGNIINSYSTANISGTTWVGGLVGTSIGATITNSYSTGLVLGDGVVGGLISDVDFGGGRS